MCLLALVTAVKPLAQAIGNHLRCDSYDNIGYDLDHQAHLPSVARMEKGSVFIRQSIAIFDRCVKCFLLTPPLLCIIIDFMKV